MSRSFLRPHFSIEWHLAENGGAAGKQFLYTLADTFSKLEVGRRNRIKPKKKLNERKEEKASCTLSTAADSVKLNKSVTFGLHSVLRWIETDGARVVLFDGQLIKPSALGLFLGAYAGGSGRLSAYAVTDLNATCRSALNLPNVRAIGFAREQGAPLIERLLDAARSSLKACEFLPAAGVRSQRQLPPATVTTVPFGKKQKKSLSKKRRKADKKRNGSAKKS